MLKELTREEFEKKYPDVYVSDHRQVNVYLENGIVLCDFEWNGEFYNLVNGDCYEPVTRKIDEDDFEVAGYRKF